MADKINTAEKMVSYSYKKDFTRGALYGSLITLAPAIADVLPFKDVVTVQKLPAVQSVIFSAIALILRRQPSIEELPRIVNMDSGPLTDEDKDVFAEHIGIPANMVNNLNAAKAMHDPKKSRNCFLAGIATPPAILLASMFTASVMGSGESAQDVTVQNPSNSIEMVESDVPSLPEVIGESYQVSRIK